MITDDDKLMYLKKSKMKKIVSELNNFNFHTIFHTINFYKIFTSF